MSDERDEIRRRIDLVDLVGQRVRLKKSGKNYTGLCPFHEDKSPSFMVSPTTGRYKCFACGESGDVFTWTMKTQGLDFREALELLAKEAGIELQKGGASPAQRSDRVRRLEAMEFALRFFRDAFLKSEAATQYCLRRGFEKVVTDKWEIGYAPDVGDALAVALKKAGYSLDECKSLFLVERDGGGGYYDKFRGRLMFPIRNERGELVGFGGRLLGDGTPKYVNSSDTPLFHKSHVLYGYFQARDRLMKDSHAILTEGYFDVIACHRAGVTGAVASLGTAFTEDHAKLLKRFASKVTILYDGDGAGQKAALRALEILEQTGLDVRIARTPQGSDPDTVLQKEGAEAVQKLVDDAVIPLDFELALLEKNNPVSSADFWKQVLPVLAKAKSNVDLERHLMRLAAVHPEISDFRSAQRAIRADVAEWKRQAARATQPDAPIVGPGVARRLKPNIKGLHSWELVLFRAILDDRLKKEAWSAVTDPGLMVTTIGRQLANELAEVFGSTIPVDPAQVWLTRLDDVLREALAELEFARTEQIVSKEQVLAAIEQLDQRRQMNTLRSDRMRRRASVEPVSEAGPDDSESQPNQSAGHLDDKTLRELNARLRKLKGTPENEGDQS